MHHWSAAWLQSLLPKKKQEKINKLSDNKWNRREKEGEVGKKGRAKLVIRYRSQVFGRLVQLNPNVQILLRFQRYFDFVHRFCYIFKDTIEERFSIVRSLPGLLTGVIWQWLYRRWFKYGLAFLFQDLLANLLEIFKRWHFDVIYKTRLLCDTKLKQAEWT